MASKTTTRHLLHNTHGWCLSYAVRGETVMVGRSYRGQRVGCVQMSRLQAREHYRRMKASGFTTPAGSL